MAEHQHHHHHHVEFDTPEMAARTELEGEVLAGFVTQAADRLAEQAERRGVTIRRVLDLGSGPGVGTAIFAERFEGATVVAADGSASMLEWAAARAGRLGVGDRVETRRVDLPDGLADLGSADAIWASMALHHVGDEVDALRRMRGLLDGGGLLALAELADPLRVEVAGTDPALWDRLDAASAAWFAEMRASLPDAIPSTDHRAMVEAAGYEVLVDEVLAVHVVAPMDERARRFARHHLASVHERLGVDADAADLAALAAVIDGLGDGDDLAIHATRHLVVARAPLS